MAATVGSTTVLASGPARVIYAEVTLDNSYAVGGEAVSANQLGLQSITNVFVAGDDGWIVQWDKTNLKFIAFGSTTSTFTTVLASSQAPSGADLSAVVLGCIVVGI